MLRASSDAIGLDVDLAATTGTLDDGGGVPDGATLVAFAEAAVRADRDHLDRLRQSLLDRLGPEATGHAAATISAFSGLVRVADGTGIPIDGGLAAASVETRAELGLEDFSGAANSRLAGVEAEDFSTIGALFDNRAPGTA